MNNIPCLRQISISVGKNSGGGYESAFAQDRLDDHRSDGLGRDHALERILDMPRAVDFARWILSTNTSSDSNTRTESGTPRPETARSQLYMDVSCWSSPSPSRFGRETRPQKQ